MIVTVDGNILSNINTSDIIVQQVNCMGVMNRGFAKLIRTRYPNVYMEYKIICRHTLPEYLLGEVKPSQCNDGKIVANIFGQMMYGTDKRYTDYDAVFKALTSLKYYAMKYNYSISIPYKMGCSLGGGDWNIVQSIIYDIFRDSGINVTIFKL